ncbi:MAG: mechanosensitive ion channel family protein [Methanoregulaceae archaeon]|nr:mechanosensitive ion channel family protein [Methanoregulaceae archaeon]
MIDLLGTVIVGQITVGDLIVIAVILFAAGIIGKVVTIYIKKSLSDKVEKNELKVLVRAVQYGILLIGVIAVLPYFQVNLSGLLVAGGIAGVIIGFASQSVVSNFVSGLFLIVERPVSIGDNITIGEVSGNVEEIRILSTIIRSYEGVYTRVPNEKVFTSDITNYVANVARRFDYTIGIGYRDDAEKAERLIRDIVTAHPFVLRNPGPSVFVDSLGESSVNIMVRLWTPSSQWYSVKKDLLIKIKRTLENQGIEIPYPQQVVWVHRPGDQADRGG